MIRRFAPFALLAVLPILIQQGTLPEGWSSRPDRPARPVALAAMGGGLHVTPGGSGIVYREADKTGDKFQASATFTQTKEAQHPEAYGIFYGGADLAGDGQKYTYFIVRADGMFSIKRRDGAAAPTVTPFTANDAITKFAPDGKGKNTLEIDATGEKVLFKVNGKVVHELAEPSRAGIVGLRINHGLDLHIDGFTVRKGGPTS